MRILHIAADAVRSGVNLLHKALLQQGEDSELWVLEAQEGQSWEGVYSAAAETGMFSRQSLQYVLHGRAMEEFDLCWVHGLTESVPQELWTELARARRLVWSIDTPALYTGGCRHTGFCRRWLAAGKELCTDCPLFASQPERQQEQAARLEFRRKFFAEHSIEILCANRWQSAQVQQSIAASLPLRVIPEPLDAELFHTGARLAARRAIGLSAEDFVIVLPTDFVDGQAAMLSLCRQMLPLLQQRLARPVILLHVGTVPLSGQWAVNGIRELDARLEPAMLSVFYRAADVQLWLSGTDQSGRLPQEAALCGLPTLCFAAGPLRMMLVQPEFCFMPQDIRPAALAELLERIGRVPVTASLPFMLQPERRLQQALAFCLGQEGKERFAAWRGIFAANVQEIRTFLLDATAKWEIVPEDTTEQKNRKHAEKGMFLDRFCRSWLKTIAPDDPGTIWQLVLVWLQLRELRMEEKFGQKEQLEMHVLFCAELREYLVRYFLAQPLPVIAGLPQEATNTIAQLWNFVFLNNKAPLYRNQTSTLHFPKELHRETEKHSGYPLYFLWSMYMPFMPENVDFSMGELLRAELPMSLRIVTAEWLLSAPLFDGNRTVQQNILRRIEDMSRFLEAEPEFLSSVLISSIMEKMMMSLWRLSYFGGNTLPVLEAYGDFLQSYMHTQLPKYQAALLPRRRKKHEPLRIGYVSANFREQAVSQYMASRIQHHDAKRFHVQLFFIAQRPADAMTKKLRTWSDGFTELAFEETPEFYARAARKIKEARLDLLVYADIGMNTAAYKLGALRLAPVQAVLVGHGTSTGLSSIDYYISGSHEAPDAQRQYSEELVRLPNAGAAQLPPMQNEHRLLRSQFGIPEDAVLFISCASGFKHVPERDRLFFEILRQAPNAYILLKPYVAPQMIDHHLKDRIMQGAAAAGVADRICFLGLLPDPGDLMPLLQLADVQLDTYPYGGWTTNLEALFYHLPIVTQRGELSRSRWGAGLLESLGIRQGIAEDEAGYVREAVRYAQEPALRKRVAERIAEQAPKLLFDGAAAQPAYEQALLELIDAKEKSLKKKR